ncbi:MULTISPECIES: hypothetical protein [unclassified Frankia]|uniref:hypothetical protein n=1 Tax=unclassified Frankia TaxID=2632575 RepID=UPI001EF5C29C|nr:MULTISPECIES: hypothetical protein [unclassified Frankia]
MSTFVNYFLFAPVFATFFGILGRTIPAMLFRAAVPRRRIGVYSLFRTGYVIVGVVSLFLFAVGTQLSQRLVEPDGQVRFVATAREHDVAPLLGTVASFAIVWLARREWLRRHNNRY